MWVSPFGHRRIDAYLPLPAAFRSLSRPSSAPSAKAFPLRPFSLDLIVSLNYMSNFFSRPAYAKRFAQQNLIITLKSFSLG